MSFEISNEKLRKIITKTLEDQPNLLDYFHALGLDGEEKRKYIIGYIEVALIREFPNLFHSALFYKHQLPGSNLQKDIDALVREITNVCVLFHEAWSLKKTAADLSTKADKKKRSVNELYEAIRNSHREEPVLLEYYNKAVLVEEKIPVEQRNEYALEYIETTLTLTSLPEKLQKLFIAICKRHVDNLADITPIIVDRLIGEAGSLSRDLGHIEFPDEIWMYTYLYHHLICKYSKHGESFFSDMYYDLMKEVLFNQDEIIVSETVEKPEDPDDETLVVDKRKTVKEAFMESPTSYSYFVSLVKMIGPHINELLDLIQEGKGLEALEKQAEIINICNREGIAEGLTEQQIRDQLAANLNVENNFDKQTFENTVQRLKKRRTWFEPNEVEISNPGDLKNFRHAQIDSPEFVGVQQALHQGVMLDYYQQSEYLFLQYSEDVNLYYTPEVLIVAYKYDDVAQMNLKSGKRVLNWQTKSASFWGKMLDAEGKVIPGGNYFVQGREFKVESELATKFNHLGFGKPVIFVPEEYLQDGYAAWKNRVGNTYEEQSGELLTTDHTFFFKNPKTINNIKISPKILREIRKDPKHPYHRIKAVLDLVKEPDKQEKAILQMIEDSKTPSQKQSDENNFRKIYMPPKSVKGRRHLPDLDD